ncbi:uncharacterized protein LOC120812712 [Gasterosteus aculeatus]
MFSSKFLSGANPLNAVSSAVNKFGLFGDDGDKNKKAPSQQGAKSGQQPGAGPSLGPQQQQGIQKRGPTEKGQPLPKEGSPQLHGNGQAGPPIKPGGQHVAPKAGTQPEGPLKEEPQQSQTKGPPQQGLPKPGAQQQLGRSGAQSGSPKAPQKVPPKAEMQQPGPAKNGVQQHGSAKTGVQKQGPAKTGVQQQGPAKTGVQQQGPAKTGVQQQGPAKTGVQQQGPAKTGVQQQGPAKTGVQVSTKVGSQNRGSQQALHEVRQQQQGSTTIGQQSFRDTPQQQSSKRPESQKQDPRGPTAPGMDRAGSSAPGPTKAGSQSRAVVKSLCPVCKTTELNVHSKNLPNHKTCSHCKTEVCNLCGFSPPDSDGREWLCLPCQIQRAQGASEQQVSSTKKLTPNKVPSAQNQTPSPAAPVKKEMLAPGSPKKMQSISANVPAKADASRGHESQKQASQASVHKKTPETQHTSGSHIPDKTSQSGRKQSCSQQESGGLFGLGGVKTEAAKTDESVTGKMFGFGSSIFSSASTLIASAVQDEPKSTPPVSPKIQSAKDNKPATVQKSAKEAPQQATANPARLIKGDKAAFQTLKAEAAAHSSPKEGPSTCPLCKMVLNMGSKDPPNYNTCTECKSTVCNQCGFNPMPNVKEEKEWLCLNCQVKRAASGIEPQKDALLVNSSFKKTTQAQPALKKTSAPGSPWREISTPTAQSVKTDTAKVPDSYKQATQSPGQKTPQESRITAPQTQPDQTGQTSQKQRTITAVTQQESGTFFGFRGPKTQVDAAKPAVTGKMFGFGSSIFSSASTLISSAVQDESKTPPPLSPKMNAAKDSKYHTAKEGKPEQPQQAKHSPSVQPKVDKLQSEQPKKASSSPVDSKGVQSTCPLCKAGLNVGSTDPPNYNTCTECKSIACNQCGFNPMTNVKEAKEWLCLNCQMQRALGASEPPGTPMIKRLASPNKLPEHLNATNKDIQTTTESKKTSAPGSPQRKPPPAGPPAKSEVIKGPESQKQVSPAAGQRIPMQDCATAPQKPQDLPSQTGHKQTNTASTTQEVSEGIFGFGGQKPEPDSARPAESLGGKVFGFGSSIFSSASTLITKMQDDSKTTPPVSAKIPDAKATKYQLAEKQGEGKLKPMTSPSPQAKVEKASSKPTKDAAVSPVVPKTGQPTCPLCKVELNFGSKEPTNYNKCTECKKNVCNQCGFNPRPNESEIKEWLCLNCQMQRALSSSELAGPPLKLNNSADKMSPSTMHQKITAPTQVGPPKKELSKSNAPSKMETPLADVQKKGSLTPGSPQKKQATKTAEGPERETQASPAPGQKTPVDIGRPPEPEASKATESVSGKMFEFGSSILSSASTLISSTVLDESRTTPPSSRKMSAPVSPNRSAAPNVSQKTTQPVSPKMSHAGESEILEKKTPLQLLKAASISRTNLNESQATCPLCKVEMNISSKDLPNYNTCTECKTTVCTQCGFNPMPIGKAHEWLCLNCQMKRAIGASEPRGPLTLKSQTSTSPAAVQLNDSPKPTTPQKKESTGPAVLKKESSEPASPQRKPSPSVQSEKPEAASVPLKQTSPARNHKTPQEIQKAVLKKPPDQEKPAESVINRQTKLQQSDASAATQQQAGSFFGFASGKTHPEPGKQAESATGKMFGFGSSIFSSASTLMTSAVTTPPVSPEMSPAKKIRSHSAYKPEQQNTAGSSEKTKTPPTGQAKLSKAPSEPPKATVESQVAVKPGQSTCPLCKVDLNILSNESPNYNTCTECKNLVCNQCGFNPMPNETAVKEWLCLTCQMQRALGSTQLQGVTSANTQIPPKPQRREFISLAEPEKNKSPQRTLSVATQPSTVEADHKPEGQKQPSPVPSQKLPQEPQKISSPNKSSDQTRQTEREQSNATAASQQDTKGFFGFGGGKTQPAAMPTRSATGKMLGFGSSIFSSAVQDQPKITPPVSPKMSPAKGIKSPYLQRKEQQTKHEQSPQTKTPPTTQTKVDKASFQLPKDGATSNAINKTSHSTCPLCKLELNMGSKDPPNYNTCTECKNTVCNQCGFNPMPNVSENLVKCAVL